MATEFTATAHSALADPDAAIARQVKPALVSHKNKADKNHQPSHKELTWDEVAIEEHDQLRGTRMKIEEPNTPFHHSYDSGSETDGSHSGRREARKHGSPTNKGHPTISWDTLQNKLDSVAAVREQYPSSPSSQGGNNADGSADEMNQDAKMDAAEERRQDIKELEFKEHRKRHYNEMDLVRKWREEQAKGGASDEDDDET